MGAKNVLEPEVNDENVLVKPREGYCIAVLYKEAFQTYLPIARTVLRKRVQHRGDIGDRMKDKYMPPSNGDIELNEPAIWKAASQSY